MNYVNSLWASFATLSSCWQLLKFDNFLEKTGIIAYMGLYTNTIQYHFFFSPL